MASHPGPFALYFQLELSSMIPLLFETGYLEVSLEVGEVYVAGLHPIALG